MTDPMTPVVREARCGFYLACGGRPEDPQHHREYVDPPVGSMSSHHFEPAPFPRPDATAREALTEWQDYATTLSEALLALGHHNQAHHQSPDSYDSDSALACPALSCLLPFTRALAAQPGSARVEALRWPVAQRTDEDCFPAALSTITGLDVPSMPRDAGWYRGYETFLRDHGWALLDDTGERPMPGWSVAVGPSPTLDANHATVAIDGRVVWDPSPLRDTPGRTFTPSGYWPVRPLAAPDPTTTPGERCTCNDSCPVHDFEVGPPQDRPPVTTGPLNARIVGIRYADPIVIEDAPTTPPAPVERAEVEAAREVFGDEKAQVEREAGVKADRVYIGWPTPKPPTAQADEVDRG